MRGINATIRVTRGDRTVDLAIEVADDETVMVVGPNGAGKSTIVEVIAGLLPLDTGTVTIDGVTVDDPAHGVFVAAEHRGVGVVFQSGALFSHLSVVDNVAFGLQAQGQRRRAARRSAREWLERLEIDALARQRPDTLSGGETQRVALARTLASEPRVLLLDEPFAAVDIAARPALRRMVEAHIRDFGGPRLIVTHHPADVYLFGDRVVVVEDGKITQSGSPEEIRRHPATPYAAALAGINLLRGTATSGTVRIEGTEFILTAADSSIDGPVVLTVEPNAIVVHEERPTGSSRNVWATHIVAVEPLGDVSRVLVDDPIELAIDVTQASVSRLGLAPGSPVWLSLKATEINVRGV